MVWWLSFSPHRSVASADPQILYTSWPWRRSARRTNGAATTTPHQEKHSGRLVLHRFGMGTAETWDPRRWESEGHWTLVLQSDSSRGSMSGEKWADIVETDEESGQRAEPLTECRR